MKMIDHNGKAFEGTPVLDNLPDGWKFNEQATTAPSGYKWANNGQPIFTRDANGNYYGNPQYQHALIRVY